MSILDQKSSHLTFKICLCTCLEESRHVYWIARSRLSVYLSLSVWLSIEWRNRVIESVYCLDVMTEKTRKPWIIDINWCTLYFIEEKRLHIVMSLYPSMSTNYTPFFFVFVYYILIDWETKKFRILSWGKKIRTKPSRHKAQYQRIILMGRKRKRSNDWINDDKYNQIFVPSTLVVSFYILFI